jgi:hypothetical protein
MIAPFRGSAQLDEGRQQEFDQHVDNGGGG